jgi:hypothetical protein
MFQNTNKKAKAQPTPATATTTQVAQVNEFIPFTSIPKIVLMPVAGVATLFFLIALKKGWLHRFFDFIARILGR